MPCVGDNVTFIAVPKTGTSWVRLILHNLNQNLTGDKHDPHDARGLGKPVIATIRHPKAWLPSVYRTACGMHETTHYPEPARGFSHTGCRTFAEFVEWTAMRPGIIGQLFEKFTSQADYVLRTERLAGDLAEALDDIGIERGTLIERQPPMNVSRPTIPCEWTDELWGLIEESEPEFLQTVNDAAVLR